MRIFRRILCCTLSAVAVFPLGAGIVITEPAEGETVTQLRPAQKWFLDEVLRDRDKFFDGGENAKAMRKDGSRPKPVRIAWKGAEGPRRVVLRRQPDGKIFFSATVTNDSVSVDSLEIAHSWEIEVSDVAGKAVRFFRTEDRAPRLVRLAGRIPNARDLGGRRGLGGKRIRQGLVFRSEGLNENAPQEYYSNEEILSFYRSGELKKMGYSGRRLTKKLDGGGKLFDQASRNYLVKRSRYAPGGKRMSESERAQNLRRWGFKSDLDLRSDDECYGMTGSPLGETVTWFHCPYNAYHLEETNVNRKVFGVFLKPENFPIVFHCIGGADRTGTVACLLEMLLGVSEEDLWIDYLTTGFVGGVTDPGHRRSFGRIFKELEKYPGGNWTERAEAYFKSIGYSERDIALLREMLMEE